LINSQKDRAKKNPSVFFAVLNMGLGHASRSLPVLWDLVKRNYRLTVGSSGRSLKFLQKEIPTAEFIQLPDYRFDYGPKGVTISGVLRKLPSLFQLIHQENRIVTQRAAAQNFDVILSDHRYGCYVPGIPSVFISHQLRFIAPAGLRIFEFLGLWFNQFFHRKFTHILIPDEFDGREGMISGRLSRISPAPHLTFCGTLSSVTKKSLPEDIDFLFSISGPEPQRTVFECLARNILPQIPGKKVLTLGKPESDLVERPSSDVEVYHHPTREKMEKLLNRSKLIISRSGYSTIMELVELRKRALLIPTPGQTEQVYLAHRTQNKGWFHWISQNDLTSPKHLMNTYHSKKIDWKFSTPSTLNRVHRILEKVL